MKGVTQMIRRHIPAVLVLALAAAGSFAAAAPASAGHVGFSIGAQIPVGPAIVNLVVGQPAYGYGYHYPAYGRPWAAQPFYYRVAAPLNHYGGHCHASCFHQGGYGYHHPSCPALHSYFTAYDVHPGGYWPYASWSPDWNSYGWQGYRAPRSYGTYGYRTYDGQYRSRYDSRYNDRRFNDRRYRDERYRSDRRHDRDDRYDRGDPNQNWRER
jgi:hypothetical protein